MTSAILDPTGRSGAAERVPDALTLAARPDSLSGLRIGLLENGKTNARRLLEEVARVLTERHGAGDVVPHRKEVFSQPAPPELVTQLSREADVVLVGVGD